MMFPTEFIVMMLEHAAPILAVAGLCYFFFVLDRRHNSAWSRTVFVTSLVGLLFAVVTASMVGAALIAFSQGWPLFDLVPQWVWYALWIGGNAVELVGGLALLGLAMQARIARARSRERQVAQGPDGQ